MTTSTGNRLLYQLKSRGPQSAATLGAACAITPMGAHKQLQALTAQGLVDFHDEVQGAGRPKRIWALTDAGHGRFPDRHGDLTVQLLRHIQKLMGPQALDMLIASREAESEALYRSGLQGLATLEERVAALTDLRSAEGYMARMQPHGEDWLLVEDHCPICAAATHCQGFCRSELALFQRCLGDEVVVQRSEHLLAGARRCVYTIRRFHPAHPDSAAPA